MMDLSSSTRLRSFFFLSLTQGRAEHKKGVKIFERGSCVLVEREGGTKVESSGQAYCGSEQRTSLCEEGRCAMSASHEGKARTIRDGSLTEEERTGKKRRRTSVEEVGEREGVGGGSLRTEKVEGQKWPK